MRQVKRACSTCPFRIESPYGYDEDAAEALDDGCEPSCHGVVGMDQVFAHAMFSPSPCAGFYAYLEGKPGYRRPRVVPAQRILRAIESWRAKESAPNGAPA